MKENSEFILYEELSGFFELEDKEMLCKMFYKLNEIISSYYNSESFVRNASGNIIVFLNDYQEKIFCMFNTLILLWNSRN